MRALVTGATGFIGSYLAERLRRAGAAVAVLVRTGSPAWRIEGLLPELTRIEGDLRDVAATEPAVRDFAPDTVFHFGWHGVPGAQRNEGEQIDMNLPGTLGLVRLAGRVGCATWIGLGSQAEYGPHNRRLNEDAPARPTTTYGVTKLCAGLLAERLAAASGLRFAWLRVFSTYGPRDNPDWMIPYVIRTLLNGKKPALTAGQQKWDYLYVTDAAEAAYQIAAAPNASGVFNVGSGRAVPLRQVIERVRDLIDPTLPLGFGEVPYRPDQVMHLEADTTRLQQATGWTPRVDLREGLRATVEWFRHGGRPVEH